ncbi:glycosyltransferase family 4 protein [bacterium]|nr:glycosyltransferase family 4 protein [bacterium]
MRLSIVFYLSATEVSGGAKVLLEHARRLAARGHETAVLVPRGREPPRFFEHGRPVVRDLPARADLVVATRYRDIEPALALAGGRARVVHLVQGDDTAGPRDDLARLHGLGSVLARRRARRKLERCERTLALPTVKLAVSEHLRERLARSGHRALLAPNGVDVSRFSPGATQDDDERRPPLGRQRVLVAGARSGPTKGIELALSVLESVRASREIEIAHLAPSLDETDARADRRVAGVPEDLVVALLRSTGVFVSAASEDEGFDLVALEAMASGVACVLSGGGAHREIAPGLVVGRDREALSRAVLRCLEEREERERRREIGLAAAGARSWEIMIGRVERAYEDALSR